MDETAESPRSKSAPATDIYRTVVPLRWSDQDVNGHVNNGRIVTLIEEARIEWLNRAAARDGIATFDCPKVIVSLNVEYRQPVHYGQELHFALGVRRIGRTSFVLSYVASQLGETAFEATTVLVTCEPLTMTPRLLSNEEVAYLARFLPPEDDATAGQEALV